MNYINKNINGIDYLYMCDGNDNRMLIKLDEPVTERSIEIGIHIFKKEFNK